jgi:hypothetical protein
MITAPNTATSSKHTAGVASVRRSKWPSDGEYDYAISCEGAPVVAEAFGRASDGSLLPAEANARLIAEAFTVAHETGLTPRQLAERCKELEAALSEVVSIVEMCERNGTTLPIPLASARAAIAKATGADQ